MADLQVVHRPVERGAVVAAVGGAAQHRRRRCRPRRADRRRVGQLGEGAADLAQQRSDRSREAVVLEQEAHHGRPSIGPRTARWYICSADSERSTPIHCTSSCGSALLVAPRRCRQHGGGAHAEHPGGHVGPLDGPAEAPHRVRLVVGHRRREHAVEAPAVGDHAAEEALARRGGRRRGRPRVVTYRYRSLSVCHASRGMISRVVRRFSRAALDAADDAARVARGRRRGSARPRSRRRARRRCGRRTAGVAADHRDERLPAARHLASAGRRSSRRGRARCGPCPRRARCTAPPSRAGRPPARAAPSAVARIGTAAGSGQRQRCGRRRGVRGR